MFICHLFKQNVSISLRLSDSVKCRRGYFFLAWVLFSFGTSYDVNYRPVSLTSIVKIMETIIRDHLMKHLLKKKLISDFQYGFRPGRSIILYFAVVMLNDWTLKLDQKLNIDVLYTDLSKAFNSIPHRRLLSKIKQFGITGNLWNWIEAFLSN